MLLLVLIVVIVIVSLGGLPTWGYHSYGYYPSGIGFLLLIILIILFLSRRPLP